MSSTKKGGERKTPQKRTLKEIEKMYRKFQTPVSDEEYPENLRQPSPLRHVDTTASPHSDIPKE